MNKTQNVQTSTIDSMTLPLTPKMSWQAYFHLRSIVFICLGFSAGLPFLLIFSTLSARLREAGVDLTTIGFFAWVGLLFSLKVLWAPIVDHLKLPFIFRLGQRRSWLIIAQIGILFGLYGLSWVDAGQQLLWVAVIAIGIGFCAATQDICIDAYRIESSPMNVQGMTAAAYIFGYRVALLTAGAGALYIADWLSWSWAYKSMAACMLIGVITTLLILEPKRLESAQKPIQVNSFLGWLTWFRQAFIAPLHEFMQRFGRHALVVLVFISCYRLSDVALGNMANPFFIDIGYTKTEIASIAKIAAFVFSLLGSAVGGWMVFRVGILKSLLFSAILVIVTNLLFCELALSVDRSASEASPGWLRLAIVMTSDNFAAGMANVGFVAFLSALVHKEYTATQYALFSSIMTLLGKFLSGFSGWMIENTNYAIFFLVVGIMGLPSVVLCWYLMRSGLLTGRWSISAPLDNIK
ncbi:MAG: MFS transporter [Pseudomonadota bacterium]